MESSVFDKDTFSETIRVLAVRLPCRHLQTVIKNPIVQPILLRMKNVQGVIKDPSLSACRLVLLNVAVQDESLSASLANWSGGSAARAQQVFADHDGAFVWHELQLNYKHFSTGELLRKLLPPELSEIPSSFETVGHIAHLNLRDNQLPYKSLIGSVILQKNWPAVRTVVNKIGSIHSVFRTFDMELLAGDDDLIATIKEHGCQFHVDFARVYWNSRLAEEHKRLVDTFSENDVVVDLFAGVGPFAIPAAKRGCLVYANDLNPHSHAGLIKNIELNRVQPRVHAFNMDARAFARHIWADRSHEIGPSDDNPGQGTGSASLALPPRPPTHVIMNLPGSAIEFLDVFWDIARERAATGKSWQRPMIHCYAFSSAGAGAQTDIANRIMAVLRCDIPHLQDHVVEVRDVAPRKLMMRATFQWPSCETDEARDSNDPSIIRKRSRSDGMQSQVGAESTATPGPSKHARTNKE